METDDVLAQRAMEQEMWLIVATAHKGLVKVQETLELRTTARHVNMDDVSEVSTKPGAENRRLILQYIARNHHHVTGACLTPRIRRTARNNRIPVHSRRRMRCCRIQRKMPRTNECAAIIIVRGKVCVIVDRGVRIDS